jgi:hypothetical protein
MSARKVTRYDMMNGGAAEFGMYVRWSDYDTLSHQRDELLALLKRYGQHDSDCATWQSVVDCTCGFRTVLKNSRGGQ